jgi:hypothetical protein
LKNIYWKCHNHRRLHRWIESVGILLRVEKFLLDMPLSPTKYFHRYISSGKIFWRAFSVCKTIDNIFFPDRLSDGMWDYRRKTCWQTLSVGDLVGKKFTNKVWISHRWIRSVDKTVKSGSVYSLVAGVFINKRKSFTKPKTYTA